MIESSEDNKKTSNLKTQDNNKNDDNSINNKTSMRVVKIKENLPDGTVIEETNYR